MSNVSVTLFINLTHYGPTHNHLGCNQNGITPRTRVVQSTFIGNHTQTQMSTDDLVLAHLQAKELESSKIEGEREIKVTTSGIKWEKGK